MLLYTLCKILKRNKIQCPDIGMCVGELPSVNDTLFSWPKRSHLIIERPLFRAGFAIPEGAPLSGDHCTVIYIALTIYDYQQYQSSFEKLAC